MAQQLSVNLPDETHRSYTITVERGLLTKIIKDPADFGLDGHVVIISNPTVALLYADSLAASLPNAQVATMQDGEQYKTLDSVQQLYDQLLAYKSDRKTTVLALGGGVVGDTAGFVAASYMRGIRLIQMPTTLLAMVDSSVGGKVGVDLPQGKNLVGAFKQPDAVLIAPDVLDTLPPEQWRAGMAEILKHGLIADDGLLTPDLHQPEHAEELVCRAVQVKIDVVETDPY
ncbi:MAG: 3-dehydroquinate synthase, partial [Anaerolineae bacterium]|nr:3-dehydroquinate synthase [Anaerolineae bacterium]